MDTTRRDFLKRSTATMLTAAGAGAIGKEIFAPTYVYGAKNLPERDSGPTLVVIYLRGGSDPLSVIVPYKDRTYYEMRPTINIPPNDVLDIDGLFGLNPAMAPLVPMLKAGEIAPIINVGSPNDTRSHFDAQDFMERAAPGIKSISEGWLNRYLYATKTQTDPELRALAIQPLLPRSLRGQYPVLAAPAHKVDRQERAMDVFEELYGCDEDRRMHRAAKAAGMQGDKRTPGRRESRAESEPPTINNEEAARQSIVSAGSNTIRRLRELRRIIDEAPGTHAHYPDTELGRQLQAIARVIRANVGLEIAAVDYNGWDHHAFQGGSAGLMSGMLGNLSRSIAAFYNDLGDRRNRVCTLVMSEFGRTVKENGNNGSDHGRGGYMLVIGGMVNGKRMYGRWTGLDIANLADGRDLPVHTDFRLVFAEVLYRLFRYDSTAVDFFPGWRNRGRPLGLLKQL